RPASRCTGGGGPRARGCSRRARRRPPERPTWPCPDSGPVRLRGRHRARPPEKCSAGVSARYRPPLYGCQVKRADVPAPGDGRNMAGQYAIILGATASIIGFALVGCVPAEILYRAALRGLEELRTSKKRARQILGQEDGFARLLLRRIHGPVQAVTGFGVAGSGAAFSVRRIPWVGM